MAKTTVGIKLDPETRERLKRLGEMRERSPHWLMRQAIDRFLDAEERYEREKAEDPRALAALRGFRSARLSLRDDLPARSACSESIEARRRRMKLVWLPETAEDIERLFDFLIVRKSAAA